MFTAAWCACGNSESYWHDKLKLGNSLVCFVTPELFSFWREGCGVSVEIRYQSFCVPGSTWLILGFVVLDKYWWCQMCHTLMWHSWSSCTQEDILYVVLGIQQVIHSQAQPDFPAGFLPNRGSKMAPTNEEPVISFLSYTCGTQVLPPFQPWRRNEWGLVSSSRHQLLKNMT